MSGKVFFILLLAPAWLSFYRPPSGPPSLKDIRSIYIKSDRLYNADHPTGETNASALAGFRQIISQTAFFGRTPETDSIFFQSFYKAGVLSELAGTYEQAATAYLQAARYAPDQSRKSKMYVFAGAGYYSLNNFDSANYFLLKAEEEGDGLLATDDEVRLYNTLGVLYYDNGNYLQAKNYFNRALVVLKQQRQPDKLSVLSVQLNMGTCSYRLGQYDQALRTYQAARKQNLFLNQIYMNMGRAYGGLHLYPEALAAFRKVDKQSLPWVLNEMARAALESGHPDSARVWLSQFRSLGSRLKTNKLDSGINMLYTGELDLSCADPVSALQHLQKALIIFSGNFRDTLIRHNPSRFTGSFAYYTLFDALEKKAAAWELMYKKTGNPGDLQSALSTYQSTISLLTYIERSYEMDDAKILLKQKSAAIYQRAARVCFDLNERFPDSHYLEDAFIISEKNKASVMASNLREGSFHFSDSRDGDLIRQERNIRFNIARLGIRENIASDALEKINTERAAYESDLAIVQKKLERNNRYYQLKYEEDYPSIKKLQESLDRDQALISLSNSPDAIQVFVITQTAFHHICLNNGDSLRGMAAEWIQILQSQENGKRNNSRVLRQQLYTRLIKPLEILAGDKKDWVLVPDGIFFLLPFESLPLDEQGTPLIEKHALSYQFSSRFVPQSGAADLDPRLSNVFAFAPFASRGADLRDEGMGRYDPLPNSASEIAYPEGEKYLDSAATREHLMESINRFPILHLATHAVADMEDPANSYIAFYPASHTRSEDFLFLGELYGLRMDSCRLVVISACETGKGRVVSNEGVMSFARAFLYAGCPSTINSLWKADDRSTSEILKRFYFYLEKGDSKSVALQKAKLDFIHYNPLYRDPVYWSHLVLTGNMTGLYKKKQPYGWAVFGVCFSAALLFLRKRKKVDAFHN